MSERKSFGQARAELNAAVADLMSVLWLEAGNLAYRVRWRWLGRGAHARAADWAELTGEWLREAEDLRQSRA